MQVEEWLSERFLRPGWNLVKGLIAPWGQFLSQNAAKYAIIDFGQAASRWDEYRKKRKQGTSAVASGFPATSGTGMSRASGPTTARTP